MALVTANVGAYLLWARHGFILPMLLDVLFLGLFGPSVEGSLGRLRLGALCLLGGGVTVAVRALAESASFAVVPFGAWGAVVAVLGTYLIRFPRGRVITLVLVPFLVTIVEVPAVMLLGLWIVAQAYFGATR